MLDTQNVFDVPVDGFGRLYDFFDPGSLHYPYPEEKIIFHLFFDGIGVIVPFKEELLAQISQLQVIGLWIRESRNEFVFLSGGKHDFECKCSCSLYDI